MLIGFTIAWYELQQFNSCGDIDILDTNALLKVIGEVFAGKADHHEMEIVAAYFADRPDLFTDLQASKHEVVLGRRGTGKTMVLKHMSFESQLRSSVYPIDSIHFCIDFIGFYVSLGLEYQPKIGPEDDPNLETVFDHWFNLMTLLPVLNVLEQLRPNPKFSIKAFERFTSELSLSLFGKLCKNPNEFSVIVAEQEREIRECCNWSPNEALAKASAYLNQLPKITSVRTFLATLTTSLQKLLAPIFQRQPNFYFLIDRFDEVCLERQQVIQHVIQVRPGQTYYVKLGVSHTTKLHLTELTNQDYRILNIEHDVLSDTYTSFCVAVLEKRFAAIRAKLLENDALCHYSSLFKDPQKLLPKVSFDEQASNITGTPHQQNLWEDHHDPELDSYRTILSAGKIPLLAGVKDIAALSSGCIRVLVEITHRIITYALIHDVDLILQEQYIPADIQHNAIVIETDQRFSQELDTSISATTKEPAIQRAAHNILDSLLRKFAQTLYTEPAIHSFQVLGEWPHSEEEHGDLLEAVSVLDRLGLVSPMQSGNVAGTVRHTYSVSRIFAVKYKLPPIVCGYLVLTMEDLHRSANPNWSRKHTTVSGLDLLEPIVVFYATGFRANWDNALRQSFRETIFAANDLSYLDGSDEHSRSQ